MRPSFNPNQCLNPGLGDFNQNQTWALCRVFFPLAWCICPATHTRRVQTVAEKNRNFCFSGSVSPFLRTAQPLPTAHFSFSCALYSTLWDYMPVSLWSLSCSTHSGIGKLHNCTTHLTFIAPLSPGHFSGLTLPPQDQWDAEFECFFQEEPGDRTLPHTPGSHQHSSKPRDAWKLQLVFLCFFLSKHASQMLVPVSLTQVSSRCAGFRAAKTGI